jgi:hypothetical protein
MASIEAEPHPPGEKDVTCPDCGALIGTEVELSDARYLRIGNLMQAHLSGYCACCGRRLYWSNGERRLEPLLEAVRDNRAGMLSADELAEAERLAGAAAEIDE